MSLASSRAVPTLLLMATSADDNLSFAAIESLREIGRLTSLQISGDRKINRPKWPGFSAIQLAVWRRLGPDLDFAVKIRRLATIGSRVLSWIAPA